MRFNLTTRIHDPGLYTVTLEVFKRKQDNEKPLASSDFPLQLEAGQKQQRLVIEVPDAKLWSPENPHLISFCCKFN